MQKKIILTVLWSLATGAGLASATTLPREPLGPSSRRGAMVVSEIMVNTPSQWGGTNSLEFIELYNSGLITEDLAGHRFSGEIDYTFPDGTTLAPGQFLVVAKDPAAAQAFYGVSCLGPYDGKLSNAGGTLRFRNEIGGILFEVEYNDKAPWPVAAFGTGHSMVLNRPSYGENDPCAWSASDLIGGSSGADESQSTEPASEVVINEYLAHTDLPYVDYIELFNAGTSAVDLSGAWLSDEAGTNKYRIANGTTIPAHGFLAFDQTQLGFALSADGESIFLVNSNLTRVLDAVSFRGQANGVSEGRYPDGAPGFQSLSSVTEGTANTASKLWPVVINEIMYHPVSDSDNDEYIELYNRTGSPVDISGWKLQDGISYKFPDNTEIPAHSYVVVAENATNLIAKYAQLDDSNTFGNYGGSLSDGGETIRLSMVDDLISTNGSGLVVTNFFSIPVDEVTYVDGGRWGQWSDGGGSSLELIDPDADNRQPASWADSDESSKAPWTTIDVTKVLENGHLSSTNDLTTADRIELYLQDAGEVLIDDLEFRNNGGGNMLSNGDFSSGSNGWDFQGVVRNSYVENSVGQGGSAAFHLVSLGRGDTASNQAGHYLDSAAAYGGSNTGTIRAKVRWLKGTPYMLIRLRGHWMEASQPLSVPDNCGTPGQANSKWVSNAGPAIHDVIHNPILPADGEDVVVTARANDPDGISSMTLHYRIDPSTSYSTATMRDNGTGGDAIAGDGLYSATLSGQSSGTMAAFYITAADGSVASQFPEGAPVQECLVRWGEPEYGGTLGTYRLWVTSANTDFWHYRDRFANDSIDATFVYGNSRVIYNAGTMYSGSPYHIGNTQGQWSEPLGWYVSDLEVNFNADERFLGAKPFVLSGEAGPGNEWYAEATTQVDLTSTWIGRKLGQQYNYRRHVNMVLNGNRRGAVYLDTQQPNRDMLDEYYSNDSSDQLRKIEGWFEFDQNKVDFSAVSATLERFNASDGAIDAKRYRSNWRPRTTQNHDNWFDFTNLVAAVNDTTAPDYESRVRTWMDVRNFLRPIALNRVVGNWDSYGYYNGKNMYAYKPDNEGWRLLPWDIEFALGNQPWGSGYTTESIDFFSDPTISTLLANSPAFHREYLMTIQEAVDTALLPEVMNPALDERYTNLLANGINVTSPDSIKTWTAERRAYLLSVLPTASFGVDGSSSFSVSSNSVVLTGTAPLQVADITVGGIAYPVEWTSVTNWNITVPLTSDLNNLTVTGVDRFGDPTSGASNALSITYTGSDPDPEGIVVISEIHPSPDDRDLQFLELHNTSATHVFDLSGWHINGIGYTFPAGSVILPGEYMVLVENQYHFASRYSNVVIYDTYGGSLVPQGETLTLYRPGALPGEEIVVDRVRYEGGPPWASSTDGASLQLIDAAQDNARVANWANAAAVPPAAPVDMIAIGDEWKYYQSGFPGSDWELPGFNDTAWPNGDALLYVENTSLPAAKNTPLTIGQNTYYFRKTFNYSGNPSGATLAISTVVDDGVILYLNGTEILRWGVGAGNVDFSTPANQTIGNAAYEYFTLPASALIDGGNVLAAEVHQQSPGSSDIVFGMTLTVNFANSFTATTPGASNSVADTLPAFPEVWLNELQAVNTTGPQDNAGDHDPWVELYNAGSSAFSLDGYYLTDDYANPTNWAFPAGTTIPPGGFLTVWCDGEAGESAPGIPHAVFALPLSAGQVGLVRMVTGEPQVVDYLNYTNLPSNYSYGNVPDGQPFYRSSMFYPTAGAANSDAAPPITVSINEWMADNNGTLSDPADAQYEDWFEFYNTGTNTVDLGGYYLTDNPLEPFKYEIPNNGHYTIAPSGFLLVWADGEDGQNSTNLPDLHADFSLSKNGESIGLFGSDGVAIDVVTFGAQSTDSSEGRIPDGSAQIFAMEPPTPRASNRVGNTAPEMDPITDATMTLGQTLNFFAGVTDHDTPAQTLVFSLINTPAGASIHPATGAFSWTPDSAPSTNTLGVVVTDNGTPGLSDTEWFTITIVPPPVMGGFSVAGPNVNFSWPSVSGQHYRVYYKDELIETYWNPLSDILTGTGGLLVYTNAATNVPARFYSIQLEP